MIWFDVVLLWFSCQNTNGVNFYNILTQEPDEELTSSAGEDFISKKPVPSVHVLAAISKNNNSWPDVETAMECMS